MTSQPRRGVVVIGIGNVVRSDDGLGVRAIERLRDRHRYPSEVELLEGGTAGLLLLEHIAQARLAIIIDAIAIGTGPGTLIRLVEARGRFTAGLTPHEAGLANLLDAVRLTDAWPEALILHGAQPDSTAIGTELTPRLQAALSPLTAAINADLDTWGYGPLAAAPLAHSHSGAARPGSPAE